MNKYIVQMYVCTLGIYIFAIFANIKIYSHNAINCENFVGISILNFHLIINC